MLTKEGYWYVKVVTILWTVLLWVQEFGDISDTLYTGPILYTSVVEELYYNVLVTNLTIGDVKIDLHCSEV